jgi:hypothetical protein
MQHLGLPPLSHAFFFFLLFLAIHDTRSWIPFSDFLMARGRPTTGGLRFGRDGRTSNTGLRVKISYAVEREVTVFLAGKRTPVAGGRGVFLLTEEACDGGITPWCARTSEPRQEEEGRVEPRPPRGGGANEEEKVVYQKE